MVLEGAHMALGGDRMALEGARMALEGARMPKYCPNLAFYRGQDLPRQPWGRRWAH